MFVELIPLLRLLAVYPFHHTPRKVFYAMFIPLSLIKLARLVNAIYFIAIFVPMIGRGGGNPTAAGQQTSN